MYFSVSSHRGRINEPGVEDAGEREGNIERVRQNGVAARSGRPLLLGVTSPGEGRIDTGGVRPAQHRLLYFRGYDARDNGAARSGTPPLIPSVTSPGGRPHRNQVGLPSRCRCSLLRVLISPAPWLCPPKGPPRRRRSIVTTQLAPRLPAAVGSAASEIMMLGSGEFVMLLLRCCLLRCCLWCCCCGVVCC